MQKLESLGISPMKLKEYFRIYRIDPVNFSVKSGISVSSIYRFLDGRTPSFTTAIKIEKATDGKVTFEDLRGKE